MFQTTSKELNILHKIQNCMHDVTLNTSQPIRLRKRKKKCWKHNTWLILLYNFCLRHFSLSNNNTCGKSPKYTKYTEFLQCNILHTFYKRVLWIIFTYTVFIYRVTAVCIKVFSSCYFKFVLSFLQIVRLHGKLLRFWRQNRMCLL